MICTQDHINILEVIMQAKIAVINKKGTGLRYEGQPEGEWLNVGRNKNVSLAGLNRGDQVEFEAAEGGWLQSITKVGNSPSGEATQTATKSNGQSSRADTGSDVQNRIARSVAVQAVMSSPLLAEALKDSDISEVVSEAKSMIEELTEYVNSGKFSRVTETSGAN
jgi:hypothetical protein